MSLGAAASMPPRVRLALGVLMVVFGAGLVLLDWPATLTDEDDYMPHALGDVLAGRDPYATRHEGGGTIVRPWGEHAYAWEATYPYLPALLFLQAPGVDYRWVALAAYAALLAALPSGRLALLAFANPLVAWFAASGFNDFVPLALLAWSMRTGRAWPAWIAVACKQGVLPLLAADALLRRSPRLLLTSLAALAVACVPFLLWDAQAFVGSALFAHADKAGEAYGYWNYWLYPLFFLAVMLPRGRAGRSAQEGEDDAALRQV